ncbi:MAG: hypothetical protein WCA00_17315 [Candidatus Acidiferrales bacterium]
MHEEQRNDSRHVSLEKQFEIFKEYVQTVLNLSTGSLVLSITFLHDIVGLGAESKSGVTAVHTVRHPNVLGISWLGFLVSIAGCLFYLYFLALFTKDGTDCKNELMAGNLAGLGGFAVGLICLAAFGWCNIP